MKNNRGIKRTLLEKCREYVDGRIANAKKALGEAQQAANEETKSSVGDKYNTQRAMMQIERDKHAVQLAEAQKLQRTLQTIKQEKKHDSVQLGSLVETDASYFFFAISIGKVEAADYTFLVISPSSPVGQALLGKSTGDKVTFNGKTIQIKGIS